MFALSHTKDNNLLGKFELSGILPAPQSVPQVEVAFNVDASRILDVSAVAGKSNRMILDNEGRLTKEGIVRMIEQVEHYRAAEDPVMTRLSAKKRLDSYAHQLRNTISGGQYADMLTAGDKSKLEGAINETISWLDASQDASEEEYDNKRKKLADIVDRILQNLHAPPGGFPDDRFPDVDEGSITIEEVD
ncbi:hypothetical protein C0992_001865 [Termitomyces sp. T32_za158]|nr:hypothetical protein C0992_001865 [Termitomyces sp. T32_za158]